MAGISRGLLGCDDVGVGDGEIWEEVVREDWGVVGSLVVLWGAGVRELGF